MNKVKKLLPIFILFFLLLPFSTHAATLYYNSATADYDWNNPGNWWQDAGFTIPGSVPGVGDDAIVSQSVFANTGAPASVNTLTVTDSSLLIIDMTVANGATFSVSGSLISSTFTGDVVFNDSSTAQASHIIGHAIFNGFSYPTLSTIEASSTFNDNGFNPDSTFNSTTTFNGNSYNDSIINGDIVLNSNGYNTGTVNGNVYIRGNSFGPVVPSGGVFTINNTAWRGTYSGFVYGSDDVRITSFIFTGSGGNAGRVAGNATFNDTSTDAGDVTGDVVFNNFSGFSSGTIGGNATFNTTHSGTPYATGGVFTVFPSFNGSIMGNVYGNDAQLVTDFIFNGNAINTGSFNANATFNNTSINYGTTTGNATFNNTSSNHFGGVVIGNATFNTYSMNSGLVTGNAVFNDSSIHDVYADVTVLATFNNASEIWGAISGNAKFNNTNYGSGIAPNGGTFYVTDNTWRSPGVSGTMYGTDDVVITNFNFSGASINRGVVHKDATFSGTSYNLGFISGFGGIEAIIYGSVTFTGSSHNDGSIYGNVQFNGASYNRSLVIGDATFNTTYYDAVAPSAGLFKVTGVTNYGIVTGNTLGSDSQPITNFEFRTGAINAGTINGDAIFYNSTYNKASTTLTYVEVSGIINGNAIFNNTSHNESIVNGNATFNTTYYDTAVPSAGLFKVTGINISGDVTGTVFGSDASIIGNYEFRSAATNSGVLYATSTFYDTSYNNGLIYADAVFHDSAYNNDYIYHDVYVYCPQLASNIGGYAGNIYHYGCTSYFNGAVDNDWFTQGNWWDDAGFTVQSTRIPTFDDIVYVSAPIIDNSGSYPFIGRLIMNSGYININLSVTDVATFNNSTYNSAEIAANSVFNGDLSEAAFSIVGTKTRRYTSSATITRNFITDGPWTVVADGAGVEVNVSGATYNGSTVFSEVNGGKFIYTNPTIPDPSPSPSASPVDTRHHSGGPTRPPVTPIVPVTSIAPVVTVPNTTPTIPNVGVIDKPLRVNPVVPEKNNPPPHEVKQDIKNEKIVATFPGNIDVDAMSQVAGVFTFIGVASFAYATVSNLISTFLPNTSEISSLPMRLWTILLGIFGYKRKNRPWGTVYDSVTKQPLDPAIVTLFDENGKEINTAITDMDGRYGFVLGKGTYTMTAGKSNYTFPSKKLSGISADELYSDLYFGESFLVTKPGDLIKKNIPMDQEGFDWNEYTKRQKGLMRYYTKRTLWTQRIVDIIFLFGLFATGIVLFFVPNTFNSISFVLYLVMCYFHMTGISSKGYGIIKDEKTGLPLSFAIVSVFSEALDAKMAEKVTDQYGKYYCLVPPGKYYVTVQNKNPDGTYSLVYRSETINAKGGVLRNDFKV